jgi:hypothetical protein
LRAVVHSPVIRADGTILAEPGYDPETRLLHLPEPGLDVPKVPDRPDATDVRRAVALLNEMVAGFPFVTEHHRANFIGFMLTPLLRELVPPPYKMCAITAPQPGSGKSLLATCLRRIHGGIFRSETPPDEAEMRKTISAILETTTAAVVQIDNVTGPLRSSVMSGMLTNARWSDRRLGVNAGPNAHIETANDRLWMITGNNVSIGGDLPRRTIPVVIDPRIPHPERRTGFAITNLESWVAEHRGELLAALLTLIRAWVVAGRPVDTATVSDDYAPWIETVRGILRNAGIEGVFDHPDTQVETGVDDVEWGRLPDRRTPRVQ